MKLLAALAIFALPMIGDASNCRKIVQVQQVAVVEPAFIAVAPYAVPAYNVTYGHNGGVSDQQFKALLQRLDALTIQLQALTAPAGKNEQSKGLQILGTRCASCHDVEVAKQKGGGMILFSGNAMAQLSAKDTLNVLKQLRTSKMPKSGAKLTDEEYAAVAEYLESVALTPSTTKEK